MENKIPPTKTSTTQPIFKLPSVLPSTITYTHTLMELKKEMQEIKRNQELTNRKIDYIIEILSNNNKNMEDINMECKKMSQHIDFIDNVYDNVKNPLGYLCNKLSFFAGNKTYALTDEENNKENNHNCEIDIESSEAPVKLLDNYGLHNGGYTCI